MKSKYFYVSFLIFAVFFVMLFSFNVLEGKQEKADKHPEVDFSISCTECHEEETPAAVKDWRKSKHGVMNFGCYMCHGDGVEEFQSKPATDSCIGCHSAQEVDFTKTSVKNCFDCHKGHTLKFHE